MNRFVIQVFRCNEWRNVTTIPFEDGKNRADSDAKRRRAYREAMQQMSGWRGYFTDPLRIAEVTINGGHVEARP